MSKRMSMSELFRRGGMMPKGHRPVSPRPPNTPSNAHRGGGNRRKKAADPEKVKAASRAQDANKDAWRAACKQLTRAEIEGAQAAAFYGFKPSQSTRGNWTRQVGEWAITVMPSKGTRGGWHWLAYGRTGARRLRASQAVKTAKQAMHDAVKRALEEGGMITIARLDAHGRLEWLVESRYP